MAWGLVEVFTIPQLITKHILEAMAVPYTTTELLVLAG